MRLKRDSDFSSKTSHFKNALTSRNALTHLPGAQDPTFASTYLMSTPTFMRCSMLALQCPPYNKPPLLAHHLCLQSKQGLCMLTWDLPTTPSWLVTVMKSVGQVTTMKPPLLHHHCCYERPPIKNQCHSHLPHHLCLQSR